MVTEAEKVQNFAVGTEVLCLGLRILQENKNTEQDRSRGSKGRTFGREGKYRTALEAVWAVGDKEGEEGEQWRQKMG